MRLRNDENFLKICLLVSNVTDGRTDTTRRHRPCLSRGNTQVHHLTCFELLANDVGDGVLFVVVVNDDQVSAWMQSLTAQSGH